MGRIRLASCPRRLGQCLSPARSSHARSPALALVPVVGVSTNGALLDSTFRLLKCLGAHAQLVEAGIEPPVQLHHR